MMSLQIKYTKKTPFVNNVNMTLEMLLSGIVKTFRAHKQPPVSQIPIKLYDFANQVHNVHFPLHETFSKTDLRNFEK